MKTKSSDYAYIDHLKERRTKPYRLRLQINGKRKIYYFNSQDEAQAFKVEARGLKDRVYHKGDIVHYSLLTLFREWVKEKELLSSAGNIASIQTYFKHLKPLYESWLSGISKEDCQNLIKFDPSISLKSALAVLNSVNKYSLEKYGYGFSWNIDGLIKSFKPRAKAIKRVRSFYKEDEIKLILDHLKSKDDLYWFHFFRLAFSLGARIGELCSLKKVNYHRSEKILLIDSTIHRTYRDGRLVQEDSSTTKNGESRVVHLSQAAIDAIEYFLLANKEKDNPYLVPKKRKTQSAFITYQFVNDVLRKISCDLGIIYLPSHCAFRKTFATQVAKASKKSHRDMIAAIQKQLGHKSPNMTLHYIQAIELGLSDELNELDKILGNKKDED